MDGALTPEVYIKGEHLFICSLSVLYDFDYFSCGLNATESTRACASGSAAYAHGEQGGTGSDSASPR